MKCFFKKVNFFIVIFVAITIVSCSSNDDESSNWLDTIPSGEIIATEEREKALTGFSEDESEEELQKWWTHVVSNVEITGPEECGESIAVNNSGFIAFYTNGSIYYKSSKSGSAVYNGSWEWVDSNKDAVYVSNSLGSQEFTLTYLNEDNIVYGSQQSEGSCAAITYEEFDEPYFE